MSKDRKLQAILNGDAHVTITDVHCFFVERDKLLEPGYSGEFISHEEAQRLEEARVSFYRGVVEDGHDN